MKNWKRKFKQVKYCLKISRRKPLALLKLGQIQLMLLAGHKPLFREVEIATTYSCNLNCVHCSSETLKDHTAKPMNMDDYLKVALECKRYHVPLVAFTGGEPLIDDRLEDIIRLFDPKSTLIALTTNGTLLDKEKIRSLRKTGVDALTISLDSPDPTVHDEFRGIKGAFDKSINAIKQAKKAGMDVTIIATIHHLNIHSNLLKMVELSRKLGAGLHVSLAAPAGNWANEEDYRKYGLTENDSFFLEEMIKKFACIRRDLDGNYMERGCPAASERICLTPSGEVLPCTKIHVSFGNVKHESLYAIRKKMMRHHEFSETRGLCIAAEDRVFIEKHMQRCFNLKKTLVSESEFFH